MYIAYGQFVLVLYNNSLYRNGQDYLTGGLRIRVETDPDLYPIAKKSVNKS